jgi:hypothetical protein
MTEDADSAGSASLERQEPHLSRIVHDMPIDSVPSDSYRDRLGTEEDGFRDACVVVTAALGNRFCQEGPLVVFLPRHPRSPKSSFAGR